MDPLIRPATPEDAAAIASVHVQSWQETYAGLIPPDFLAHMTSAEMRERRAASWRATIDQAREAVRVAEQGGGLVAFASVGPARDHPGYGAELMCLYSLARVQGRGTGRALLHAAAQDAWASGARNLALWVLDVNPTRAWYARQGAREAGEKRDGELREIRMVWDELTALLVR